MSEKRIDPWGLWEQCEDGQGEEALSSLSDEFPEFFDKATLVGSRCSRLSFYAAHRLMELQLAFDRGVKRAFALHGPERTVWLSGESDPIHTVNDAESLALTRSTAGDYARFFLYFLRADEGAFVLVESADEVGPRADAGDESENQDEVLTFEAVRDRASPLVMRGDGPGYWLFDGIVAYGGGLFDASLTVEGSGNVEMVSDEPIGMLGAVTVPEAPSLELDWPPVPPWPEDPIDIALPPMVPVPPPAWPDGGVAESFVGRTTEQEDFGRVLGLARGPASDPDQGHVVLIHGPGGIGKSTLLRRLHEIAGKSGPGSPLVAKVVDFGDEQRLDRDGYYAGPDGPQVGRLFDLLHNAVRDGAADKQLELQVRQVFADFRLAMQVQPELLRTASQLGVPHPFGRRRMSAEEISTMVRAAAAPQHTARRAAMVGPVGTTAQVASAMGAHYNGPVDVAPYAALADRLDRLVDQFAQALKELSCQAGPLVMFIDTGELLGAGLEWLRYAAQRSGSKVVWVLGLRLKTESEPDSDSQAARFRNSIHKARLHEMQLTRFDDAAVEEYLRGRLGAGDSARPDIITRVAQVTHGIPLAVALVTELLGSGQDPAVALAPVLDGEVPAVISALARRYLRYATKIPRLRPDLPLLYGLALLYGDVGRPGVPGDRSGPVGQDPEALAALWDVPPETVEDTLGGLAKRHDFVHSSGRLHQDVRESVLLLLLDPDERERFRVSEMTTRAAALYRERAARASHRTVDAQIADQGWQAAVIALLRHTFWADCDQGLQMLKGLFVVAVTLDVSFAADLLRTTAFFAPACTAADRRLISDLQLASDPAPRTRALRARRAKADASARTVIEALKDRLADPLLAAAPPAAAYYDLLQARWNEALGLSVPDRADLLLRAASGVEPGGATARAITSLALPFAVDANEYRGEPAGRYETVISALGLLTRFEPGDAFSHHNRGTVLYSLGRPAEAEAAYREALRLNSREAGYHNNLGNALYTLGRPAEAEAAYREALGLDSSEATYHHNLGNALYSLGRPADAEGVFRDALRLNPRNATYHNSLGNTLYNLGRPADAEAAYREAVRLNRSDSTYHHNLGVVLLELDRPADGEVECREAVRLDPDNASFHDDLGDVLFELGRPADAEAAYREALRLDPDNAMYHNDLGNALYALGRHVDAEVECREAVRLDPDNATFRTGLGIMLIGPGRWDDAEAAFREAARLDSSSAEACNGLGYVLACLGRYADAEAAYHEALRLNPSFINPHAGLGRLYLKLLGRVDEAGTALREALRLDSSWVGALAGLGSLYVITGELDEARSSFLQATQSPPAKHAFSELMLGALDRNTDPLAAAGHFTAALTALDQPDQPTTLTPFERAEIRALALAALDRGQEATAVLERAVSERSGADVFQRQHYELFNGPARTTGIDALIAIWEDVIASDDSAAGPWGGPRTLP